MNWRPHITTDPKILYGKPTIKGTRISVDLIIDKLATGESFEYLLSAYPHITLEQIYVCLAYAADQIRHEEAISTRA
ncbi:DUF433 domain-containing protein [Neolewinella sp.]|uniref:DUF433 domain-containing protein n=1 Tax=Neolewinella sp. TaxID=2993543 RepID=UPI003B524958